MRRTVRLAALVLLLTGTASGQQHTLRMHHFLSEPNAVHQGYLVPWARRVEEASDGRIRVEIYPSMQLGGAPASLIDQVASGVVDLAWTLPGYTPGRFPLTEAFELPFTTGRAEPASQALCAFYFEHLQDEYADVRVIALHTAGSGVLHVRGRPVRQPADLRGRRVRAPSRVTADALALLGADPIGMPVPEVPEALSRGVVDGALLPWEVTLPLRIAELTDAHTEFGSRHGIYASTFVLAMNLRTYESLGDDLRGVVDAHSIHAGCEESRLAGANVDRADVAGRQRAVTLGNRIHVVPEDEVPAWREALRPVEERWIADMEARGRDGRAILARARALVEHYETTADGEGAP